MHSYSSNGSQSGKICIGSLEALFTDVEIVSILLLCDEKEQKD